MSLKMPHRIQNVSVPLTIRLLNSMAQASCLREQLFILLFAIQSGAATSSVAQEASLRDMCAARFGKEVVLFADAEKFPRMKSLGLNP